MVIGLNIGIACVLAVRFEPNACDTIVEKLMRWRKGQAKASAKTVVKSFDKARTAGCFDGNPSAALLSAGGAAFPASTSFVTSLQAPCGELS